MHSRFPNLGVWQRDWEPPGNLTLEASRIWLQNLHRTGEIDSWRAQTKPCVHQDPGERNSDITRDWYRLDCECPGVFSRDVTQQMSAKGLGELNRTERAQDLLKEVIIIFITLTIVWSKVKQEGGTKPLPSTENWKKGLLSMAFNQNKTQFHP